MVDSCTTKVKEAEQLVKNAKGNYVFRARQVALKPKREHHGLNTTKPSGLLTIEPKILQTNLQCALATRAIVDVLSVIHAVDTVHRNTALIGPHGSCYCIASEVSALNKVTQHRPGLHVVLGVQYKPSDS